METTDTPHTAQETGNSEYAKAGAPEARAHAAHSVLARHAPRPTDPVLGDKSTAAVGGHAQ